VPPAPPSLLIRRTEVAGRLVDVHCADGIVTAVGEAVAPGADVVIDAAGGALLPGLHDHHVHLLALAAARASIDVGPPAVTTPVAFDDVLRSAPGDGWVRAVGYHDSIAGPLDRRRLDDLLPHRPARVQHRSGQLWVLNSAALALVGLDVADGRLYRMDDVLRARITGPSPDVAAAARELAGFGISGVTDLTAASDPDELTLLADAARRPGFPLHVAVTGAPALADLDVGLPRGPVKVVLDEASLPPLDVLVGWFHRARVTGRAVAVHCVTRVELVLALAAWDEVGAMPGDRVEHAAVAPVDQVAALRRHGLTVVTQPSFVAARGDQYLAEVDADDLPHLWPCGSLLAGGVGVAASSDAPYGDANPWHGIAAARDRKAPSGTVIGPAERITARRALELYLTPLADPGGPPRRIVSGGPADLCLLAVPLATSLRDPAATTVAATVTGGAVLRSDDGR
jgi:predicted amidohydrolase YtcJ